tara:strand:- start:1969 stop:2691 length:723 start_codon:yes stop_codon:yes gene_type:complete
MITIKKNEKPNLKKCVMRCDNKLHDKLDKYEITKFMNTHTTNLLIGKSRSGKTSTLYSFFKSPKLLKKVYHNIYIFQPSHSRSSMEDDLFGQLPTEQLYDELDEENLLNVMNIIKGKNEDENNCIIIDDMSSYLKDNDVAKILKNLIMNRRHYHCSIYFLTQTYYSVPREIRRLFSNLFIFKVSKDELTNIFKELVEDKTKFNAINEIRKMVFDKPFQYLFLNTDTGRMFKGFDELIFQE